MNIKYVVVIVALCLAVVFLGLDKCGSSRKADELRGQAKEASEIAKVEKMIKEKIIKEQWEEIEVLNATIEVKNTTIAKKEKVNVELDSKVAELEGEFGNLLQDVDKIDNLTKQIEVWKEKFTLAQSIIADKDDVIFSLNAKYNAQLKITNSCKTLYESLQGLVEIRTKQVRELEKINRRLKFTSKLKTGIVVAMAGVVLYSLLKD